MGDGKVENPKRDKGQHKKEQLQEVVTSQLEELGGGCLISHPRTAAGAIWQHGALQYY